MSRHECSAQWRLFTRRDFDETLEGWTLPESATCGVGRAFLGSGAQLGERGHIHAGENAVGGASRALRGYARALKFEHGKEGKIPRANTYRPYRLTLDGKLAAAVALRASEAFNLCEIDVFLTTELPGLARLEPTRAALLFAFSDAVKCGGSMAVQFSRRCAPNGLPPHVRAVAAEAGVALQHAGQGTLSPDEVRELFLRLCRLPADARQRIRNLADRRFSSIERVCQLVATGVWPATEAACILLGCPYPELVLGAGVAAPNRLLVSHAMVAGRMAVLAGLFGRALRYVAPTCGEDRTIVEREQYRCLPQRFDPSCLAVRFGRLPAPIALGGWSPDGNARLVIPPQTEVVALPLPRPREEIRVFLRQDLDRAGEVAGPRDQMVLLVYPADLRWLPDEERTAAGQAARARGVSLLACPDSSAGLEAEVWRRLRVGRTTRP